jgi:hypothetical protein
MQACSRVKAFGRREAAGGSRRQGIEAGVGKREGWRGSFAYDCGFA